MAVALVVFPAFHELEDVVSDALDVESVGKGVAFLRDADGVRDDVFDGGFELSAFHE